MSNTQQKFAFSYNASMKSFKQIFEISTRKCDFDPGSSPKSRIKTHLLTEPKKFSQADAMTGLEEEQKFFNSYLKISCS